MTKFTASCSSLTECGPHRTQSRSVSWSAGTGTYLAMASSDSMVHVWSMDSSSTGTAATGGGGGAKEVTSLTGHTGPVLICHFHPVQETLLCSASTDSTVRLWDIRTSNTPTAQQKVTAKCMVDTATAVAAPIVSVQWNGVETHVLAVTTRDGTVTVYDTRKLLSPSTTTTTKAAAAAAAVHTVSLLQVTCG